MTDPLHDPVRTDTTGTTSPPDGLPPPADPWSTIPPEVPSHKQLRPGDLVRGFRLLKVLGEGTFAVVFLARQVDLDRLVALKVSLGQADEARTLAGLEHGHIVRVFSEEVDPERNLRSMCMQYVAGTTLARVIEALHAGVPPARAGQAILDLVDAAETEPVPLDLAALRDRERLSHLDLLEAACWIGARLAEALACAHTRGVLHRDVKPANVLVDRYGRPLLADFNVSARWRPEPGPSSSSPPREAGVGGTLAYMAPEHIDAFNPNNFTLPEAVDARSDLFSLGVVLFEFLTGRLPFPWPAVGPDGDLLQTLADGRRSGMPPLAPDHAIPARLERILARCLTGSPSERYPSAAELATDLDSCRAMLRVERRLPPGYVVTPLALSQPFVVGAFLVVFPHLLAGAANFAYNTSRIVGHFTDEQKRAFLLVALLYNAVTYPLTIGLFIGRILPLLDLWRRLARPHSVDPEAVTRARQRALSLPVWGLELAGAGWVLAGFVFPLGIYLGSTISWSDAEHFLASFTLSGLIAMTYSALALEFIVVRVLYPGLWLDARNLRTVAAEELRSTEYRLVTWQLMAVLIPLAGAALLLRVGPESFDPAEYRTFRLLVSGLLGLGTVGLGLALLAAGILRQTVAVLTGTGPAPTAPSRPG